MKNTMTAAQIDWADTAGLQAMLRSNVDYTDFTNARKDEHISKEDREAAKKMFAANPNVDWDALPDDDQRYLAFKIKGVTAAMKEQGYKPEKDSSGLLTVARHFDDGRPDPLMDGFRINADGTMTHATNTRKRRAAVNADEKHEAHKILMRNQDISKMPWIKSIFAALIVIVTEPLVKQEYVDAKYSHKDIGKSAGALLNLLGAKDVTVSQPPKEQSKNATKHSHYTFATSLIKQTYNGNAATAGPWNTGPAPTTGTGPTAPAGPTPVPTPTLGGVTAGRPSLWSRLFKRGRHAAAVPALAVAMNLPADAAEPSHNDMDLMNQAKVEQVAQPVASPQPSVSNDKVNDTTPEPVVIKPAVDIGPEASKDDLVVPSIAEPEQQHQAPVVSNNNIEPVKDSFKGNKKDMTSKADTKKVVQSLLKKRKMGG